MATTAGPGEGERALLLMEAGRSREARTDELGVGVSEGECGDWGRGDDIVAMAGSLCRSVCKSSGCSVGSART